MKKTMLVIALSVVLVACGCVGAVTVLVGAIALNPAPACAAATPLDPTRLRSLEVGGPLGTIDWEQIRHGATIVEVGTEMYVPVYGQIIAVATAMQESRLINITEPTDHDSLGLFQQRPSQGWGTPAELTDPRTASQKFYEKLTDVVDRADGLLNGYADWELLKSFTVNQAAQAVQRSAYPDAYGKHEQAATVLVQAVSTGEVSCTNYAGWVKPVAAKVNSGFRGKRPDHQGVDLGVARDTPVRAASAGVVVVAECDEGDCNRDGSSKTPGCGWYVDIKHPGDVYSGGLPIFTRYCHLNFRSDGEYPLWVKVGDEVKVGQVIGLSGNTGESSGPHLHFEVHLGDQTRNTATDPVTFMKLHAAELGPATVV